MMMIVMMMMVTMRMMIVMVLAIMMMMRRADSKMADLEAVLADVRKKIIKNDLVLFCDFGRFLKRLLYIYFALRVPTVFFCLLVLNERYSKCFA